MTVRDLIEALEELPVELYDCPAVTDGVEITDILVREEMYLTCEHGYSDATIVKLY